MAGRLDRLLALSKDAWLRKLLRNEAFSEDDELAIRQHVTGKEVTFDLPKSGERYSDWYAQQCGKLSLPGIEDEIPIPSAPVMAGVLTAGEIVKEHAFSDVVLDSYYFNTLMGNFMRRVEPRRRQPRPTCRFCQDEGYLGQYRRRWTSR